MYLLCFYWLVVGNCVFLTITVIPPPEDDKTKHNITIVVAVVCAAVVAGIVIGVIYCLVKKKQCCVSGSFPMQRFRNQDDTGSSIALGKNPNTFVIIVRSE